MRREPQWLLTTQEVILLPLFATMIGMFVNLGITMADHRFLSFSAATAMSLIVLMNGLLIYNQHRNMRP